MTKYRRGTIKHGLSAGGIKHPLYKMWERIKRYCYTLKETDRNYPYYRGKGIKMCDEWRDDAKALYDWCMKNDWQQGMEIDRIDSSGDYCPENCQILTKSDHCKKSWRENSRMGEDVAISKLTSEHVIIIKMLSKLGYSSYKMAEFFQVSKTTIKYIVNGKNWKHIKIYKENFMPGSPRPNKKCMKIAFQILNTPKDKQQDNQPTPPAGKVKQWFRDSSSSQ
jgi:hypothetical protein